MITRASNSQSSASILRDELDQTQQDLETAQRDIEALTADLEDTHRTLHTRNNTLGVQDEELAYLRTAISQAEDAIDAAHSETDKRTKEFQRAISRHEEAITELQAIISSRDNALKQALMSSEMSKTSSEDVKSRLSAYLAEIDRLSLKEAEMGKLVEDLRRKSADNEVKRVELNKRIEGLERDRELLNIALDSKQTELVLLQRATPTPTPRSNIKNSMTKSTSAVPHLSTPTPRSRESLTTPMPSKRLSVSISSSDISNLRANHTRRESGILAIPPIPNIVTPKAKAPILGESMRHNRRESSIGAGVAVGVKKAEGGQNVSSGKKPILGSSDAGRKAELTRQSSLPVLKGRGGMI